MWRLVEDALGPDVAQWFAVAAAVLGTLSSLYWVARRWF